MILYRGGGVQSVSTQAVTNDSSLGTPELSVSYGPISWYKQGGIDLYDVYVLGVSVSSDNDSVGNITTSFICGKVAESKTWEKPYGNSQQITLSEASTTEDFTVKMVISAVINNAEYTYTVNSLSQEETTLHLRLDNDSLIEFTPEPTPIEGDWDNIPNNQIWYTSTNNTVLKLSTESGFGATFVSNKYENGIGIITFDGDVTSTPSNDGVWGSHLFQSFFVTGSVNRLALPKTVTKIGSYLLWNSNYLFSFTVPDSVSEIEENAFYKAPNIIYNGNATGSPWGAILINGYIEDYFLYSDNTKENLIRCNPNECPNDIIISKAIKTIDDDAFTNCDNIEKFIVESGNTEYDSRDNCNAIIETKSNTLLHGGRDTAIIPQSIEKLASDSFKRRGVYLTSITIPSNITDISIYTFSSSSYLSSITWNASEYDGKTPFKNKDSYPMFDLTSQIKSFTFGDDVKIVPPYICSGMVQFSEIKIPYSVTKICYGAFDNCSGLTSITIPNNVTSIGDGAFERCVGIITPITIPNSVTSIGRSAFCGCTNVTSITIGNGIKEIESSAFTYTSKITRVTFKSKTPPTFGANIFSGATKLSSIYVPSESVASYKAAKNFTKYRNLIRGYNNKSFLDLSGLSSFWKSIKSRIVSSTSTGSYLKITTGSTQSMDINQDRVLKGTTNTGTKLVTDGYVTEQITNNSDEALTTDEVDGMFMITVHAMVARNSPKAFDEETYTYPMGKTWKQLIDEGYNLFDWSNDKPMYVGNDGYIYYGPKSGGDDYVLHTDDYTYIKWSDYPSENLIYKFGVTAIQ